MHYQTSLTGCTHMSSFTLIFARTFFSTCQSDDADAVGKRPLCAAAAVDSRSFTQAFMVHQAVCLFYVSIGASDDIRVTGQPKSILKFSHAEA